MHVYQARSHHLASDIPTQTLLRRLRRRLITQRRHLPVLQQKVGLTIQIIGRVDRPAPGKEKRIHAWRPAYPPARRKGSELCARAASHACGAGKER
jgi:hypothetical protein